MTTASVQKVDGVLMVVVPSDVVSKLRLEEGSEIGMEVAEGVVSVSPKRFRHYNLNELLEQYDASAPLSEEDRAWLSVQPVGREIL